MINARKPREGAVLTGPVNFDDHGYVPHHENLMQVRKMAYPQGSSRLCMYPPVITYSTETGAGESLEVREPSAASFPTLTRPVLLYACCRDGYVSWQCRPRDPSAPPRWSAEKALKHQDLKVCCMHHLIRADIRRESSCTALVNPLANIESLMFFSSAFDTVIVYNIAKGSHRSAPRFYGLLARHLALLRQSYLPTPKAPCLPAPHSIQSLSKAASRGSIALPPLFCKYYSLIHAVILRFHNLHESPFTLHKRAYSPRPKTQRFSAPYPR